MSKFTSDMPRIALIVDNPFRDLPGLTLVAWRLCQAGAMCYLVPMNLQVREVSSLAPDFVLLNYLRTNNEAWARTLLKAGIRIGVLDTEGSIFTLMPNSSTAASSPDNTLPAMDEYALAMARDVQVRHKIACFCAWTPSFADYACRAGWYRPEQIVVTGPPRIDYYARPWREAAQRMSAYADAYPPPLILIAGSFAMVNPCFQTPERELELMSTQFAYDCDLMKRRQQVEMEGLRGLAALANGLAHRFPNATVVYRPHPFEGDAIYRDLLDPLPNLHLTKQGTVDGWLLRAAVVISLGSSTAIEAGLANVPALAPGWLSTYCPVPMVDAVSVPCPTPESLTKQVAAALEGRFALPPEIAANIQHVTAMTYYQIDGRAHERVAEAILAVLNTNSSAPRMDDCRNGFYGLGGTGRPGRERAKRFLFTILGPSLYSTVRRASARRDPIQSWERSEKRFDAADVQRMVAAIEAVAPANQAVSVTPAQAAGAYHFGYQQGRAVVMCPA